MASTASDGRVHRSAAAGQPCALQPMLSLQPNWISHLSGLVRFPRDREIIVGRLHCQGDCRVLPNLQTPDRVVLFVELREGEKLGLVRNLSGAPPCRTTTSSTICDGHGVPDSVSWLGPQSGS